MLVSEILDGLSSIKVLVIGDVMLDHYIWGDVTRISPEAPVPVVNAMKDTYAMGGAANVASNLANLGVKTSLLGNFSDDFSGKILMNLLVDNKINPAINSNGFKNTTIIKTRVLVRGQQLCRIDRELSKDQYNLDSDAGFQAFLEEQLSRADAVIISDYAKGVVTQSLLDKILNYAATHQNLLVAIDPKPSNKLVYHGVDLMTPNRKEALALAGLHESIGDGEFSLEDICHKIYELHKPKLLAITLGQAGIAICESGKLIEILPTQAKEVFDVSGAGDTVIATIAASLCLAVPARQAVYLANVAAGIVITHMGTTAINCNELQNWFVINQDYLENGF